MTQQTTEISICHWDGYESQNIKSQLVKGCKIIKDNFNMSTLKIYAGNKYKTTYSDLDDINVKSLKELFESEQYKEVLRLGFKTIVIVAFAINDNGDDYWRTNGPNNNEYIQFKELSELLSTYKETEFILSNWESDCVLDSINDKDMKKTYADNIISLINLREKSVDEKITNVKIALEVNRYYQHFDNSISYILPKVICKMISYSCYQTLHNKKDLDSCIDIIKSNMKPYMELYIGEFGFPINKMDKLTVTTHLHNAISIFNKHDIRLAFYWNLYCNEKIDDKFNGFGIIDVHNNISYIYDELVTQYTYTCVVRHGLSLANKWKTDNNKNYINTENALLHNLYDSELSYDGIKDIKNYKQHFWDYIFSINFNQLNIIISPLRRAIDTFYKSIKNSGYSHIMKKVVITINPSISEYSESKENFGMHLDSLMTYTTIQKLQKLVKAIKFEDFPKDKKWFPNKIFFNNNNIKFNHMNIFFTHWGFAKKHCNVDLKNFGNKQYYHLIKN